MATENGSQSGSEGVKTRAAPRRGPNWLLSAHAWFEAHYGLDLRSIAALRIGLSCLLLSDLITRSVDLRAHYTDLGILPRERLVEWGQKLFYSLHTFGGDRFSQGALFLVAGAFAVMLLVGYRTRLAAFVSWILLCSLQGRNYIILQGGDDILRVMLFWSMFVPIGARFSLDAVLAERAALARSGAKLPIRAVTERRLPRQVLSLGTMVLVMQLFTMYLASAALKTGPTWHRDGSAIQLALHHHAFVSAFGEWFRQLPTKILQGITWQVWWLELCGPLLFFIPWNTYWWRTVQTFAFMGFHFGLFLTMELGFFPWVAIVAWLVVLPSWFWDRPVYLLSSKLGVRGRLRELSKRIQTLIIKHQQRLGRPGKLPRVRPTWVGSLVLLVFASYTAYGSAYAMTHSGNVDGERFEPLLITRLYANWGMFAPNPPNTSGWFVTVAKQKSGAEIDVWNDGAPVTFDPPRLPSATYKRQRWRKFGDNILSENHAAIRAYFLRWQCLEWNENHEGLQQIESITLYHMAQTANWPEKGYGPLSENELARENCPLAPGAVPPEAPARAKPSGPSPKRRQTKREDPGIRR